MAEGALMDDVALGLGHVIHQRAFGNFQLQAGSGQAAVIQRVAYLFEQVGLAGTAAATG